MHIDTYYPEPFSLEGLPPSIRLGLIPVGILALLSICLVCSVLAYMCYWYPWKSNHQTQSICGQYVMLITNLLIADLLQSVAMTIGLHWVRIDAILAPTLTCFLQGWLLHMGDVSSAIFVLLIALHTFATLILELRIRNVTFYWTVAFGWALALLLTISGVFMHGLRFFVRAGAWCWVSENYGTSRLFLHYFWLFFVQLSTCTLYMITMLLLVRKMNRAAKALSAASPTSEANRLKVTRASLIRTVVIMTAYPVLYVLLTLPLSVGRMLAMAGHEEEFSNTYACVAAGALTSCGWADSLLYVLTRRRLFDGIVPQWASGGLPLAGETNMGSITTASLAQPAIEEDLELHELRMRTPN